MKEWDGRVRRQSDRRCLRQRRPCLCPELKRIFDKKDFLLKSLDSPLLEPPSPIDVSICLLMLKDSARLGSGEHRTPCHSYVCQVGSRHTGWVHGSMKKGFSGPTPDHGRKMYAARNRR